MDAVMEHTRLEIKIPADTWWDVIQQHASNHPDRPAFLYQDQKISYEEFVDLVDQCAQSMRQRGIRKGDCIALLSPPRPEAMITFFAAARIGAVWVGLNPKYKIRELSYVISHAQPVMVMTIRSFEDRDYQDDLQIVLNELEQQQKRPDLLVFDGDSDDDMSLLNMLAEGCNEGSALANTPMQYNPDDPCMLVYTSGTTGNPKGVLLSQTALLFRSTVQANVFHTKDYPVVINFAPINHIGGMHFRGLSQILAGASIVYQDRYRPAEIMPLITRHKVNMLMLGSTMLQMLLREPSFDITILRKMEWFIFSGAAMPLPILQRIKQYCPKVGSTYGLTESCGSVSYIDENASMDAAAYTIGRAIPSGQLRIVNGDQQVLAQGQQGELQIRKRYCMTAYLRNEQATVDAFTPDGWLRTGDTAVQETDGNFRLVGRMKEMYKSGGYNIYPREIELVLEQHPKVLMAAVIPVDDELYQQVGHAYLIYKPNETLSENEMAQWCRERLANYKVPKRIFLHSSLPMLSIGKVDKIALRSLN